MKGQASGIAALSQNFRALTSTAPITAPPSRPMPADRHPDRDLDGKVGGEHAAD